MNQNQKLVKYYLLSLLILLSSCKNNQNALEENSTIKTQNDAVEVSTSKVTNSNFSHKIFVNGKVVCVRKNKLYFKSANLITSIHVKNGSKVAKNDVLAVLENSLSRNHLDKEKIGLQKAKNKLEEEKINYKEGDINPSILTNLEIKSGFLEAKNGLERAQIEYEQTFLKAPFTGIIANLEKKEGDFITSSDEFCTIIDPTSLEVHFSVLENEAEVIKIGQEIEIQLFSNSENKAIGKITEINPLVDENGFIKLKAEISSKQDYFLDGANAKVFINYNFENIITVPKNAVVLRANREVVFTVVDGRSKWNYVEIAGENNDSYAIKSGLAIGDIIITSGNLNLGHDVKVISSFKDQN
ncbi:efflux RND transporter periplasmic adaptor subunit [Capnocytophaga canis]|uniref:Putative ABC transport system lipoprotein n=1 Tax=Capnocytophaga canis TaxID=1848903 RepID=A0A0B7INW9_9FLAO|nr:efflux RND transporter periplasmic adaptor subunit [Capnocytophaga canis]CEN53555.1 putative ABC transport system lipoprotein [Capnocytophaga canis]